MGPGVQPGNEVVTVVVVAVETVVVESVLGANVSNLY
jgi:hypothetical protein